MYKWFLTARYLRTKLIAFFGVASVALCVAMVLVVMSVMGGFLDTIRDRARQMHSEIVLDAGTLQGFPFYEEFSQRLARDLPDVVRTSTPAIYTYGIFRVPANTDTKAVRVLGVRLEEYKQVNDFGNGLHYDRYYPGTTHLGEQPMPVAGIGPDGQATLPSKFEAANAQWRAEQTDPEVLAKFDALPFATTDFPYVTCPPRGESVYAASTGDPGFADPELPGMIVGCDLLNIRRSDGNFNRYLARGAQVALTLMPLSPSGNPMGEPPTRLNLRYADDSRTGIYEIDNMCVYVDFDILQHRLAMDPQPLIDGGSTKPRTNQLLIGLTEGADLDESRDRIANAWGEFHRSVMDELDENESRAMSFVEVYTWEGLQQSFIAAVEKEKVLVTILFGLISVVAVVLLGCIFYMIVEKKTRDIGILKSAGASSLGVAVMFIMYAGAVGVVGAGLGVLLGSAFVWNINDIQELLASVNPALRVWNPEVYSFDRIPEVVKVSDQIWIGVVAVVASMFGSLIPAIIAGRVWPVEALRYE